MLSQIEAALGWQADILGNLPAETALTGLSVLLSWVHVQMVHPGTINSEALSRVYCSTLFAHTDTPTESHSLNFSNKSGVLCTLLTNFCLNQIVSRQLSVC